jgi:hypothetical protein
MLKRTEKDEKLSCPACGALGLRGSAKFCLVCGKLLAEDYQPLDTIRSAYGLQRMVLDTAGDKFADAPGLFMSDDRNTASQLAWACLIYSLVPYLGILFVPFTIGFGLAGYSIASRRGETDDRSLRAVGLSAVVLGVQILLWWLLYVIPTLGHGPL